MIWGGAIHLSPVDDLLVRVERALDVQRRATGVVCSVEEGRGRRHPCGDRPAGRAHGEACAPARGLAGPVARTWWAMRWASWCGADLHRRHAAGAASARCSRRADLVADARGRGSARRAPCCWPGKCWNSPAPRQGAAGRRPPSPPTAAPGGSSQAIREAQGGMRMPPVSAQRFEVPGAHGRRRPRHRQPAAVTRRETRRRNC